jgi:hypothetical protein
MTARETSISVSIQKVITPVSRSMIRSVQQDTNTTKLQQPVKVMSFHFRSLCRTRTFFPDGMRRNGDLAPFLTQHFWL